MLAQDIISIARERLGDQRKQRWTDERLLNIVSQGQMDICEQTGYYRLENVIPLIDGTTRYKLPPNCLTVRRVEFKDDAIPLNTRNDRDGNYPRISSADFVAVKSNLNLSYIDLYPEIPELDDHADFRKGASTDVDFVLSPLFGVITLSNEPSITVDPDFGVVSDVNLDYDSLEPSDKFGELIDTSDSLVETDFPNGEFGVTTDIASSGNGSNNPLGFILSGNKVEISGKYGLTVDITDKNNSIRVFYTAMPDKLTHLGNKLILPELWEALIVRYVIGTALQDDNDANNIQRGELELTKYQKAVDDLADKSAKDFSSNANDKYETQYRRV